jgi:hypothetical protein
MKFPRAGQHGAMDPVAQLATPVETPARSAISVSRTGIRSASQAPGRQLEHDRLEQRAERVRQVLRALRERADARDGTGGAPRPLRAAIEDFGRELAELEGRMRQTPTRD